jgi:uncharacterized protein (TIGR00299 family) protein
VIAYFDCFSGASGDMIVGALLDAGLDLQALRDVLATLPLDGYSVRAESVRKGALGGTQFSVEVAPSREQPPRHLSDILALLEESGLPATVKSRAATIFRRLGEAEARVHRQEIEEVHFHEVGAVDSIVDVVGAVAGLELLGVDAVYASALPVPAGGGRVVAHGWIPLPGPATLELLAAAGAPVIPAGAGHDEQATELVTPTGAAILTALASFARPAMTLRRVGYGAGWADLPRPNLLRLWLGDPIVPAPPREVGSGAAAHEGVDHPAPADEALLLLETNIDDMSPQVVGYLFEALLADGALDVYCAPITMKKNRPATLLSVLCRVEDGVRFRERLLRETTTLGIRVQPVWRHAAARALRTVETPYGPVRIKLKLLDGVAVAAVPEYEDCLAIARTRALPLQQVLREAQRAADAFHQLRVTSNEL